jgi:hypothetical protein
MLWIGTSAKGLMRLDINCTLIISFPHEIYLTMKKISICRTRHRQHRTWTKVGEDIWVRVRGDMTVLVWKDK